jgi:phosphatidylglycerol:prolipoprotein diacylglycerol transferase
MLTPKVVALTETKTIIKTMTVAATVTILETAKIAEHLNLYGPLMLAGLLISIKPFLEELKKNDVVLSENQKSTFEFGTAISGLIGAKIFYLTEYHKLVAEVLNSGNYLNIIKGGYVSYGGFMGAAAFIYLFAKANKIEPSKIFDALVRPFFLGYAIGRIGCYTAGCCSGETSSQLTDRIQGLTHQQIPGLLNILNNFAIAIPNHINESHIPTQFIDVAFGIGMYLALKNVKVKYPGQLAALGVLIYSVQRFFIEFLRTNPICFLNLSSAQIISLLCFGLSSLFLFFQEMKQAKNL